MEKNRKDIWEKHWLKLSKSDTPFSKFLYFYRKYVIANSVAFYSDKYFPKGGTFVECGSGTSQTSFKMSKYDRNFIALDISKTALLEARKSQVMDFFINADIMKLPFKDGSIDGLWNIGVMEHFTSPEIESILDEFYRVMKTNAVCILFWPPSYAPYRVFLDLIEVIANKIFGRRIQFFPTEPSLLHSKKEAEEIIEKNNFSKCSVHYSIRDLFTYYAVICKK